MREAVLALGLVAFAAMTLGTDWHGVQLRPGVWRDAVSPWQWLLFGTGLLAAAAGTARLVRSWPRRLLVLLPVLLWLLWQLQVGTLWPIAFAIYGAGMVACWLAGLALGHWLSSRQRPPSPAAGAAPRL